MNITLLALPTANGVGVLQENWPQKNLLELSLAILNLIFRTSYISKTSNNFGSLTIFYLPSKNNLLAK